MTYRPDDIVDGLLQQRPSSCCSQQCWAQTLPHELKGQWLSDPVMRDGHKLLKVILRRGYSTA